MKHERVLTSIQVVACLALLSSGTAAFADAKSDLISAQQQIIQLQREKQNLMDQISQPIPMRPICMTGYAEHQEAKCVDMQNNLQNMSTGSVVFDGRCEWHDNSNPNSVCYGRRMRLIPSVRFVVRAPQP